MSIAQLRSEISARKFQVMELDIEIGRTVTEIRSLMGSSLTPNRNIPFHLVADLAAKVAGLQEKRQLLQDEIDCGEKELAG